MQLSRLILIAACAAPLLATAPAYAGDYNAEVTFRLFTGTCMRRLGVPEDIRTWAKDMRLTTITDPEALSTFVGVGPKGAAWILPSPNDRKFTLSIMGGSQTCAIWAEAGDPETAEGIFRKMVANAVMPGGKINTDEDQSFATASGKSRLLTMSVTDPDGAGYSFTLMGGDRSGTFFSGAPIQLSVQMSRLTGKKK